MLTYEKEEQDVMELVQENEVPKEFKSKIAAKIQEEIVASCSSPEGKLKYGGVYAHYPSPKRD